LNLHLHENHSLAKVLATKKINILSYIPLFLRAR